MEENQIATEVIGAAIEVHRILGPGLLESAYRDCLVHELSLRKVDFETEVPLAVEYKGLDRGPGLSCRFVGWSKGFGGIEDG